MTFFKRAIEQTWKFFTSLFFGKRTKTSGSKTTKFTAKMPDPKIDKSPVSRKAVTSWLRQKIARKRSFRTKQSMAHNPETKTFGTFSPIKPLYMFGKEVRIRGRVNMNRRRAVEMKRIERELK